jgi:MYXO-CTERM domain-containing protein
MMRELFRKKMGLAVLAGLGLSAAAATSANAALITLEFRAVGASATGTKSAVVGPGGGTVNLEVWANVANGDADHSNDGFQLANMAFVSADGGPLGDLAPLTYASGFIGSSVSQQGTLMNRDANPDLEVGGADPAVVAGWVLPSTGTSAKFGSGTGAGDTSFLLGTTTWTLPGTGGGGGAGSTNLNVEMRVRTTGTAVQQQTVKYVSDGVAHSERGDVANIAVGAPVTVTVVPEPAALGLLGLGALAGLRRRRA